MKDSPGDAVRIRTLGSFEVAIDGRSVPEDRWPRQKTKSMLKFLVTSPGTAFTVDQIIESLFPDANPERAARNVQARVSELRRVLEPNLGKGSESQFIRQARGGYALVLGSHLWIDTIAFADRLTQARALADAGDWMPAVEAFEGALALYLGDFLMEDRYAEWAEDARRRHREQYLEGLTRLAACYAELDRLRQAISCCQRILGIEPYRESVVRQLMRLQEQAGHRAQALDTYREGARALADDLGVDPSSETLALYERIRGSSPERAEWDPRRIAVLPFANYSPDPEDDYLADGMTEELIGSLAKVRDLRVIARTSVMRFRNSEQSVSEIAGALSVGSVVEGSVRKLEDRIRVSAQLIDARTEEHLWAGEYEGDLVEALAIQKNTAREVANALEIRLVAVERNALEPQPIVEITAETLFLKGRFFMAQRHPEATSKGRRYLEQAVELDPSHARAYAALADVYTMSSEGSLPIEEAHRRATTAATRALRIDSELAEAHSALGLIRFVFDQDTQSARQSLARALEINPSLASAHDWLGYIHGRLGEFPQAVASYRAATVLDPLSPYHLFFLARALAKLNRFDEALGALDRALEVHPLHPGSLGRKIWCHHLLHDWDGARSWLRISKRHHGHLPNYLRYEGVHYLYLDQLDRSRASLEAACARGVEGSSFFHGFATQLAETLICMRKFEESVSVLEQVLEQNPTGLGAQGISEPLFHLGIALEQSGRRDEALAALRRGYEFLFGSRIGLEPWKPSSEKELSVWIPAAIGMVNAATGDHSEAQEALEGLRTCPRNRGGQSARAVLCFRMGLLDEGFEALDLAVENHDWFILTIKTHPWFDPARDDPRFDAVLERMNLAD